MNNAVYMSADDELTSYIQTHYTPEYGRLLQLALQTLQVYEVSGIQDTLCELLYAPISEDPDILHHNFATTLEHAMTELLDQHGLTLTETSLNTFVEIAVALIRVQHALDPIPYLRLLELNTLNNEEKLSRILQDFCGLDESQLMLALAGVEDGSMERLITSLETTLSQKGEDSLQDTTDLDQNLRWFFEHAGKTSLGYQVVYHGMKTGFDFETYLSLFKDMINTSLPQDTAMNALSLIYMGSDTWQRPLEAYRQHSEGLIKPLQEIQTVEAKLAAFVGLFEQFKQAKQQAQQLQATTPTVE